MHINANLSNVQALSRYGASNHRAESTERAVKTRRRLRRAVENIEANDSNAGFLVGEWLSVRHNQALAEDDYTPGPATSSTEF